MYRYLSLVDVKSWIDENKEEWNDPASMPDFWKNRSWRERAARCCGIPVEDLGYAPKESSARADAGTNSPRSPGGRVRSDRVRSRRGSHGLTSADASERSKERSEFRVRVPTLLCSDRKRARNSVSSRRALQILLWCRIYYEEAATSFVNATGEGGRYQACCCRCCCYVVLLAPALVPATATASACPNLLKTERRLQRVLHGEGQGPRRARQGGRRG